MDVEARRLAQQAEWLTCSGLGQVPHGASHGIGYILTEMFDVPHGYASCVLLPAVLRWNHEVCSDKQQLISQACQRPEDSAEMVVNELIASLGLPVSLDDVIHHTIDQRMLREIAERALRHPVTKRNPRQIGDIHDVMAILHHTLR